MIKAPNKLVVEAVVENKLVVVAFVEVELRKVIFWKVDEAFTRRLTKVAEPEDKTAEKRFVDDAVVLKKFVEVALVVVALVPVKLAIVEEALTTAPATCANATDEICWRGARVSKSTLSSETSTFRNTLVLVEKS